MPVLRHALDDCLARLHGRLPHGLGRALWRLLLAVRRFRIAFDLHSTRALVAAEQCLGACCLVLCARAELDLVLGSAASWSSIVRLAGGTTNIIAAQMLLESAEAEKVASTLQCLVQELSTMILALPTAHRRSTATDTATGLESLLLDLKVSLTASPISDTLPLLDAIRAKATRAALLLVLNYYAQYPTFPPQLRSSTDTVSLPESSQLFIGRTEIARFWFLKSNLPSVLSVSVMSTHLTDFLYHDAADKLAADSWKALMSHRDTWALSDLKLSECELFTPQKLADLLPCSDIFDISLGDMIVWRMYGWLYLALQTENRIYGLRKLPNTFPNHMTAIVLLLQTSMNAIRSRFVYTKDIHTRLTTLAVRLSNIIYPPFPTRFFDALAYLDTLHANITRILERPHVNALHTFDWNDLFDHIQNIVTIEWSDQLNVHVPLKRVTEAKKGMLKDQPAIEELCIVTTKLTRLLSDTTYIDRFWINPHAIHPIGYFFSSPLLKNEVHQPLDELDTDEKYSYTFQCVPVSLHPLPIIPDTDNISYYLPLLAQIMTLNHPNIACVFGASRYEGRWVIVSEYGQRVSLPTSTTFENVESTTTNLSSHPLYNSSNGNHTSDRNFNSHNDLSTQEIENSTYTKSTRRITSICKDMIRACVMLRGCKLTVKKHEMCLDNFIMVGEHIKLSVGKLCVEIGEIDIVSIGEWLFQMFTGRKHKVDNLIDLDVCSISPDIRVLIRACFLRNEGDKPTLEQIMDVLDGGQLLEPSFDIQVKVKQTIQPPRSPPNALDGTDDDESLGAESHTQFDYIDIALSNTSATSESVQGTQSISRGKSSKQDMTPSSILSSNHSLHSTQSLDTPQFETAPGINIPVVTIDSSDSISDGRSGGVHEVASPSSAKSWYTMEHDDRFREVSYSNNLQLIPAHLSPVSGRRSPSQQPTYALAASAQRHSTTALTSQQSRPQWGRQNSTSPLLSMRSVLNDFQVSVDPRHMDGMTLQPMQRQNSWSSNSSSSWIERGAILPNITYDNQKSNPNVQPTRQHIGLSRDPIDPTALSSNQYRNPGSNRPLSTTNSSMVSTLPRAGSSVTPVEANVSRIDRNSTRSNGITVNSSSYYVNAIRPLAVSSGGVVRHSPLPKRTSVVPPSSTVNVPQEVFARALAFYRQAHGDLTAAYPLFAQVVEAIPEASLYMAESHYYGSKTSNFPQDPPKSFPFYVSASQRSVLVANIGVADCLFFGFNPNRPNQTDISQAKALYASVIHAYSLHASISVSGNAGRFPPLSNHVDIPHLTPRMLGRVHAGYADCLFSQRNFTGALEHYRQAVRFDGGDAPGVLGCRRAWARLAQLYTHNGTDGESESSTAISACKSDLDLAREFLKKARGCRREVLAKCQWFEMHGETERALEYQEEYLWRYPYDF